MKAKRKVPAKKRANVNTKARAKSAPTKTPEAAPATVQHGHGLKPGQMLERQYKGQTLRLQVTTTGFLFNGTPYRSLTAAAKAATKYPSISGVVFWLPKRAAKVGA